MHEQTARIRTASGSTTNALDTKLLLKTLTALKKGNFSIRLPNDWTGVNGKIADTLNDVIEMNDRLVKELERISRVVGREGKITQRAAPPAATAEQLRYELKFKPPEWILAVSAPRDPWFVSKVESLKAIALVESPLPFRLRKIFVLENFLSRV